MFYYAQINDDNKVVGVSELKGEVAQDDMILISSYDESLIGKIWNGVSFELSPEPTYLYLHLQMVGDGREPVGIKNDGVDALSVTATFRQTDSSASPVITAIDGESWRVTVRGASGDVYDIVDVTFTAGVASFDYTTDQKADVCSILESDLEEIEIGGVTYVIRIVGENTFKVYRQL